MRPLPASLPSLSSELSTLPHLGHQVLARPLGAKLLGNLLQRLGRCLADRRHLRHDTPGPRAHAPERERGVREAGRRRGRARRRGGERIRSTAASAERWPSSPQHAAQGRVLPPPGRPAMRSGCSAPDPPHASKQARTAPPTQTPTASPGPRGSSCTAARASPGRTRRPAGWPAAGCAPQWPAARASACPRPAPQWPAAGSAPAAQCQSPAEGEGRAGGARGVRGGCARAPQQKRLVARPRARLATRASLCLSLPSACSSSSSSSFRAATASPGLLPLPYPIVEPPPPPWCPSGAPPFLRLTWLTWSSESDPFSR